MAKLIVKSPYIKGGGKAKAGGFMSYIATRDGVELLPVSGYMDYMGNRSGVEKLGEHGLFGDEDAVNLAERMAEIDAYSGNIWTHIISLKREDAARLGYDNAKGWQYLLRTHRNEIATAMKIPPKNFRWYAAFHDEGNHPHVHMMAWSSNPKEGYLNCDGIRDIRSELTNDIFKQEMLHLYEQKSEFRNELVQQSKMAVKKLAKELQQGDFYTPELRGMLLELSQVLATTKGKKSYGYLSKPKKKLVDDIVDEMAKHPVVETCYRQWQDLQAQIEGYYHDREYQRKRLSQEKTFHTIKNVIIQEADRLHLNEVTFEEIEPVDGADQAIAPDDRIATQLLTQASSQGNPYAALLLEQAETSASSTVALAVSKLFHRMGQIFQENTTMPKSAMTIDRKRFAKLMEKRQAQGMKDTPEQTQGYSIDMGGY